MIGSLIGFMIVGGLYLIDNPVVYCIRSVAVAALLSQVVLILDLLAMVDNVGY